MRRRKLLIGAGALAAGSTAAVGSGAFTSVKAQRTVSVAVAGDASALLALRPVEPNGAYVTGADDGALALDLSSGNGKLTEDPAGVNDDAITVIESVFEVVNQGTNEVEVDLLDGGGGDIVAGEPGDLIDGDGDVVTDGTPPSDGVYVYFDSDETRSPQNSNPKQDAQRFDGGTDAEIQVGEAISVDVTVVTKDGSTPAEFSGSLTIEADGTDAGPGAGQPENGEKN